MALSLEFADGDVAERAVERTRFWVGENKQNFHGQYSCDEKPTLDVDDTQVFHYNLGMHMIVPKNG